MKKTYIIIGIVAIVILYLVMNKEKYTSADFGMNKYSVAKFTGQKLNPNEYCDTSFMDKISNFKYPNTEINNGDKPFFENVNPSTDCHNFKKI